MATARPGGGGHPVGDVGGGGKQRQWLGRAGWRGRGGRWARRHGCRRPRLVEEAGGGGGGEEEEKRRK